MWFWPVNVKAWWLLEEVLDYLSNKVRDLRIAAQLEELDRLHASLAELSG